MVAALAANYTLIPGEVANTYVSSGPDNYITFRWQQFGDTYINGVLQNPQTINHNLPNQGGMWWWTLSPGNELIENITIDQGAAPPS